MQNKLLLVSILITWSAAFVLGDHGPFKATFVGVGKCNTTTKPWDKNPSLIFNAELYNSSSGVVLMRGNITVFREESYKRLQITSLMWENGGWKLVRQLRNVGCTRTFFPLAAATMGIKFNSKTCVIQKGNYPYSNFDLDRAVHLWKTVGQFGRQLWTFEVTSSKATIVCKAFESLITPA